MNHKKRDFGFVIACYQEVYQKMSKSSKPIKKLINNNLSIKKYSQVVHQIIFMYMGFPDDDPIQKPEVKRYSRRKKWIEIGLKLDYAWLLTATPEAVLPKMAQLYLEAIKLYPTIRGKVRLEEFDYLTFYTDVKALFLAEGWVKMEQQVQTG